MDFKSIDIEYKIIVSGLKNLRSEKMRHIYAVFINDYYHNITCPERFENKKKYKVERKYGLKGLAELTRYGLKKQIILISDELLSARWGLNSDKEKATQHIICLARENKVLLVPWGENPMISTTIRKQLISANILYEDGTQVPPNDPYPWGTK